MNQPLTAEAAHYARSPVPFPTGVPEPALALRPARVSSSDSRFGHEIAVPRTCLHVSPPPPKFAQRGGFVALSYFSESGAEGLSVAVSVVLLPREVDAARWLEIELDRAGAHIVRRRDGYGPAGLESDLVTLTVTPGGTASIARHRTVKDGRQLFWIEVAVGHQAYAGRANEVLAVLQSFQLLDPEGSATAEPLEHISDGLPIPLAFDHPSSWVAFRSEIEDQRCSVLLLNRHESRDVGRLYLRAWRKPAGEEVRPVARFREHYSALEAMGARLNGCALLPVSPHGLFRSAWLAAPSSTFEENPIDVPAILMEGDQVSVLLGLVSPSRAVEPRWWAVNQRAFAIVHDSTETPQ